jgi:2-oxoglutarate ferredoxin oxidoreductase subunit delta
MKMKNGEERHGGDGEAPSPKGTIYLNEDHCKGCSYCVVFCPTEALAMGGRMNRKGYHLPEFIDPMRCNGCDMCGMFCPDFAIFGINFKKQKKAKGETS